MSAKANWLNNNDLYWFYRQELCRFLGGWSGGVIWNFYQCW